MGGRLGHPGTNIAKVVSAILRALPICTSVILTDPRCAVAQTLEPAVLNVDIPSQPLTKALATLAAQTGLQVAYVSGVVRNQRSHAVPAGLNAERALARMLRGTGLRFEYLTPRSFRILPVTRPVTTNTPDADEPEEIVVTANRREEALQNVPIAIQVLTGAMLDRLSATTFDDFVSYLPGVTEHGVGPGQNNVYIRGLATDETAIQGSGFNGVFPNVALYLDEQPAQLPGRNLDVYAADLDRIEVLEGPQGTLFGAGAQSGVLRYITNKPRLDVTEAIVNAGYATTAQGSPSTALSAILNVPILPDRLAMRGVIYNERRGGYIDNIPATFARSNTDASIAYAGGKVPSNSVVINNAAVVAKDINPVTYKGIRVETSLRINDDWNALLSQSYQTMEADGVFTEEVADSLGHPLPDLAVQLFNPSYNKDRFEDTALTIEGRLGNLKLLYAGSYLVRNVEQVEDYTNYARTGLYVDYYQCIPGPTPSAQCFSPGSTWRNVERNTHQSHEVRFRTADDLRLRAVGGLFYESFALYDQIDWYYLTALPYFNPIAPPTAYYAVNGSPTLPSGMVVCACVPGAVLVPGGVTSNNPGTRPLGDGFFNDITRYYKQRAIYGSVDFEIVPHILTLTAGTRYSSTPTSEVGSFVTSFGCSLLFAAPAPNPCIDRDFGNLNALHLDRTYSGFKSRANLSWTVTEDALLYYTWSQGFRAGGFNRGFAPTFNSPVWPGPGSWQAQARAHGGWVAPLGYAPDSLTNNELGWKVSWLGHRLYWSGAAYQEDWNHAQVAPDTFGGVLAVDTVNGGNYRVRGIETSAAIRLNGLTVEAAVSWNRSRLVREATFRWADGTPIDFSSLQTSSGQRLSNPAGTLGDPLAAAPIFQGRIRARYDINFDSYGAFAELGAVHQSSSLSGTDRVDLDRQGNPIAYPLPSFTTYDGALGIARDGWLVRLYGENLTDKRAKLYENNSEWYQAVTVNRPRTIGLRFTYAFRSAGPEP